MNPTFEPLHPKRVLCIAAHPDDLEFGMSGSVAKWAAAGAEVHYVVITDGGKGSEDKTLTPAQLTATRKQEQQAAADILGVKSVQFLDYEDGALEVTRQLKRDLARLIRQTRPEVVMTMDPTMVYVASFGFINHPDHRAAGQATLDAVFPLSRDHLSFPELLAEGHEPHKTRTVLLVNFEHSNYYEDISTSIETKMEALAAHASQMADIAATQTMMRGVAAQMGQAGGMMLAEGFVRIDID